MKVEIRRLPDINKFEHLPAEYEGYGRFGITKTGLFYVLQIQSSHPGNTRLGGYWATNITRDTLYLSARGSSLGFEEFVQEVIENGWIKEIAKAAGIKYK